MALAALLATLAGLPEATASLYVKRTVKINGQDQERFVLDVTEADGFALEDVRGLRGTVAAVRSERDDHKAKLDLFGDITPTQAKTAVEKVTEFAKLDPKKQAEEAVRIREEQLVTNHKKELSEKEARLAAVTNQLQDTLVLSELRTELAKVSDSPEVLVPHLSPRVKMRENATTKAFERVVLDRNGHPGIADGAGTPMQITHLIEEFRANPQFKMLFKGTGSSGSGGAGNGQGGAGGSNNGSGNNDGSGAPKSLGGNRDPRTLGDNIDGLASGKVVVGNAG